MQLLIRRSGNMIDLSPDGYNVLPPSIVELLDPYLQYTYKRVLRGAESYDLTGHRDGMEITPLRLYKINSEGRLETGYGYIPRLASVLGHAGHDVRFQDLTPPSPDRPLCYEPVWDNVLRHNIQFRPRQMDLITAVMNNLGGIINAPTGFGKTFLLWVLALLYPHARIAIVVKSVEVADKIVRRLTAVMPNVGFVSGKGKKTQGRLTVYTAGSMHHCDGDVDFLFADEVHQLMSPKHSEDIGCIFRRPRCFGLTATPEGRMDGAGAKLECYFGPEIFRMTYAEAVALGLVVPIYVNWLTVALNCNPAHNKTGVPKMRWGIWRNQERNAVIANDARQYPADMQVLINVATFDHAVHLWQCLPEYQLCYAAADANRLEDIEHYKRNNLLPTLFRPVTPDGRYQMQRDFESKRLLRVIATDVWSTGVDFEQLQVFYNISARQSEILDVQGPGRTSRVFEGKEYGEVKDCIDVFDKGFKRKSDERRSHYRKIGWEDNWPSAKRNISIL